MSHEEVIKDCEALAAKWKAQQVIVIATYPDGTFQTTSYGATRVLCATAAITADLIHALVEQDTFPLSS
jgi:hypothetical protein